MISWACAVGDTVPLSTVLAFENNSFTLFTLYMESKQTSVNGFMLLDIIQDYLGLNVNVIISVISA